MMAYRLLFEMLITSSKQVSRRATEQKHNNIMYVSSATKPLTGAILPVVVNVSYNNDMGLCFESAIWTCVLILFLILKAFLRFPLLASTAVCHFRAEQKKKSIKHIHTYISALDNSFWQLAQLNRNENRAAAKQMFYLKELLALLC